MTPGRGNLGKTLRTLLKTVFMAALAGALIDAALPPKGVTQGAKNEEATETPQIGSLLENLIAAPAGKQFALREADVNAYLKRERFKKLPAWFTDSIPLRALVNFDEGTGRLTFQASIAGYPLYATLSGSLNPDKDAGLVATCTGGNIGRLQIPAQLAQYAGWAVPALLDSMKRERQLLGQLGAIEISKEQVILRARGSSAQAAPKGAPAAPKGAARRPAVH